MTSFSIEALLGKKTSTTKFNEKRNVISSSLKEGQGEPEKHTRKCSVNSPVKPTSSPKEGSLKDRVHPGHKRERSVGCEDKRQPLVSPAKGRLK